MAISYPTFANSSLSCATGKIPLCKVFINTLNPWLLQISVMRFSLLCIFKKIAKISSWSNFRYIHQWRNSFTHVFLVTNDFSVADLVLAYFWQTWIKAKRTGCTLNDKDLTVLAVSSLKLFLGHHQETLETMGNWRDAWAEYLHLHGPHSWGQRLFKLMLQLCRGETSINKKEVIC